MGTRLSKACGFGPRRRASLSRVSLAARLLLSGVCTRSLCLSFGHVLALLRLAVPLITTAVIDLRGGIDPDLPGAAARRGFRPHSLRCLLGRGWGFARGLLARCLRFGFLVGRVPLLD